MNTEKKKSENYLVRRRSEEASSRKELAIKLLMTSSAIMGMTIFGCLILIAFSSLEPEKAVTLILAVSSIFSGLLGSAITYYFSR